MYIEGDHNTIITSNDRKAEPAWMPWAMLTIAIGGIIVQAF